VAVSACICVGDVDEALVAPMLEEGSCVKEEEAAGLCLRVALLQLVLEHPEDERARYWRRACPPQHFAASHMACWRHDSPAAAHVRQSVAWRRSRVWLAQAQQQCKALAAAGLSVDDDLYVWAALVVQTRSVATEEEGPLLCPGLDCANHSSAFATAHVRIEGGMVRLVANGGLEEGAEVSLCYDTDADYLDMWERWGFFDSTSSVHTAEVVVPPAVLHLQEDCAAVAAASAAGEEWRRELVLMQAEIGCNPELNSWWVPDVALDTCPLLCAVRALYVSEAELQGQGDGEEEGSTIQEVLCRPITREEEARTLFAELLDAHLQNYGTWEQQGSEGREAWLTNKEAGCRVEVGAQVQQMALARALIAFEKRLFSAHLRLLRTH